MSHVTRVRLDSPNYLRALSNTYLRALLKGPLKHTRVRLDSPNYLRALSNTSPFLISGVYAYIKGSCADIFGSLVDIFGSFVDIFGSLVDIFGSFVALSSTSPFFLARTQTQSMSIVERQCSFADI